jgi:nitrogen fixation protein FixH
MTNFSAGNASAKRREVTGGMVLLCLLAFFAVVASVNAVMIGAALSTFAGLESASPYQEGLLFDREIAAARAQEARHWHVDMAIARVDGGASSVTISARDADGAPLSGLTATVTLLHPADQRMDHDLQMTEVAPGRFTGSAPPAAGQWDAVIELSRDGTRMFRSKSRIILD